MGKESEKEVKEGWRKRGKDGGRDTEEIKKEERGTEEDQWKGKCRDEIWRVQEISGKDDWQG